MHCHSGRGLKIRPAMFSNSLAVGATAGSMLLMDAMYLFGMGPAWNRLAVAVSGQPIGGRGVRLWAPLMAYGALVFAAVRFVVQPALRSAVATPPSVFASGAALGIAMYAVFDGTNAVLFAQWPLSLAIVDILWGGLLIGASSAAGFWAARTA